MNILLAIKPDYAHAILTGTKTVELRSYLPPKLNPGATIYLVSDSRIWGHCTFAGATPMPAAGPCRDKWLAAISVPAAVPVSVATSYLVRPGATGYAWHIRYPVPYGTTGRPHTGSRIQRYMYTTAEPHTKHPRLANYLLYLKTHKQ